MDGEWVSGLLSENGSSRGNSATPKLTYREIFYKFLPYYLSIGMSADEYWHGEVELAVAYREAYKIKRREENFNLWLQGRYIYDALLCASPMLRTNFGKGKVTAHEYVKPYDMDEEDRRNTEERIAKEQQKKLFEGMQKRMANINKKFKK